MYYSCRFIGVLLIPLVIYLYTTMSYAIVLPHPFTHPISTYIVIKYCCATDYAVCFCKMVQSGVKPEVVLSLYTRGFERMGYKKGTLNGKKANLSAPLVERVQEI